MAQETLLDDPDLVPVGLVTPVTNIVRCNDIELGYDLRACRKDDLDTGSNPRVRWSPPEGYRPVLPRANATFPRQGD